MGAPKVGEWADMMGDTIIVYPFVSRSVSGVITYSPTGTSYSAYIRMKNHLAVDRGGRTVTARGYAILNTRTVIGIEDKIVLPADYQPVSPPLIDVDVQNDENGNHHTKLTF